MNLKAITFVCILFTFVFLSVSAQNTDTMSIEERTKLLENKTSTLETLIKKGNNFKISGYIQTQYQNGQNECLSLKVGDPLNEKPGEKNINRIGIRRGRLKFSYEENIYLGVFQLDMTEKGVNIKDAYFQLKDPWTKTSYIRTGLFNRPFGYEIAYSSSNRESPERSEVFQKLFPEERDLGASLNLQAPSSSPLNFLKLNAGFFAGNGIRIDSDNRKDFIGHLSAIEDFNKHISWGLGFSYYNGSVFNPTENLYVMENGAFKQKKVEAGSYAKREYMGFDAQLTLKTTLGQTQIRGEYLLGTQPGTSLSSKSPNYSTRSVWEAEVTAKNGDGLYKRNFNGYYIQLVQSLGKSPFSLTLKYDYYDPNTRISAKEVALEDSNTSFADLAVQTLGFGGLWDMSKYFRLMAYYEVNKNEAASNAIYAHSILYNHDRKDNVFTLRLQYKF